MNDEECDPDETGQRVKSRLWWGLLLIVVLSALCGWLLPDSIAYSETGKMTAGYFLYGLQKKRKT